MRFKSDETGAVTVDWVVLTAALVGLGLAVMAVVSGGVEDLSDDIEGQLTENHITTSFVTAEASGEPYDYACQFNCARYNLTYSLPDNGRTEADMQKILRSAIGGAITSVADMDWSTIEGAKFDEFAAAYNALEDQGWTIPEGYDSLEAYETAYLAYLDSQ